VSSVGSANKRRRSPSRDTKGTQPDIVSAPYSGNHTIFFSGPPGSGKTTLAVRRLLYLLEQGVPAEQILVLVPQRTLAGPYYQAIHSVAAPAGGLVDVATIGGLARRTIELFWPLLSEAAGLPGPTTAVASSPWKRPNTTWIASLSRSSPLVPLMG